MGKKKGKAKKSGAASTKPGTKGGAKKASAPPPPAYAEPKGWPLDVFAFAALTFAGEALGGWIAPGLTRGAESSPALFGAVHGVIVGLCVACAQFPILRARFGDAWGWLLFLPVSYGLTSAATEADALPLEGLVQSGLYGAIIGGLLAGVLFAGWRATAGMAVGFAGAFVLRDAVWASGTSSVALAAIGLLLQGAMMGGTIAILGLVEGDGVAKPAEA